MPARNNSSLAIAKLHLKKKKLLNKTFFHAQRMKHRFLFSKVLNNQQTNEKLYEESSLEDYCFASLRPK